MKPNYSMMQRRFHMVTTEFYWLAESDKYAAGFFTTWSLIEKQYPLFDIVKHDIVLVSHMTTNKLWFEKENDFGKSVQLRAARFQPKEEVNDWYEMTLYPNLSKLGIVIYDERGKQFEPAFKAWIDSQ